MTTWWGLRRSGTGCRVIGGGEERFACHRVMGYRLVVAGDRRDGGEA